MVEEVHPEIIEAEIGDGDAGFHILQIDDFLLEPAKLFAAVGDVVGLRVRGR